jgi:hypothetical protein
MPNTLLIALLPITFIARQAGFPPRLPAAGIESAHAQMAGTRQDPLLVRLHQIRVDLVRERLGLSLEKANHLADRWDQYDSETRACTKGLREIQRQINDILVRPISESQKNAELRPLMRQYATLRQRKDDARRSFEEDVRGFLTEAQQGRFLLVEEEFRRSMLEALRHPPSDEK